MAPVRLSASDGESELRQVGNEATVTFALLCCAAWPLFTSIDLYSTNILQYAC